MVVRLTIPPKKLSLGRSSLPAFEQAWCFGTNRSASHLTQLGYTLSHMLSEEFHLVLIALPCGFVLLVHQEDVRLRVVLVAV